MSINFKTRTHNDACRITPSLWVGWGKSGCERFTHMSIDFLFWGASINTWRTISKKTKPQ